MLDEYSSVQRNVYRILKNALKNDKISHAYLLEANGYKNALPLALAFAKTLFCPYQYTNNKECKNCSQCKTIDENNFIELKIIEPDGMWIKKEQLDNLQKEFSMKSIASNKKIYIINHADKLNVSSANTILKFLEEPSENIIAILIADNLYQIMDTILSRCQILSLQRESNSNEIEWKDKIPFYIKVPDGLDDTTKIEEKIENIKKFIKSVENQKKDTLLFAQRLWHEPIVGREMNVFAFEALTYFYRDVLAFKMNIGPFIFHDELVKEIASLNEIKQINQKLKYINKAKENIQYNANIPLLLDKLIIELSDTK